MINNENPLLANSIWSATSNLILETVPVSSSSSFDIAIIGGGLSGVSIAFHCARLGLNICLIEKETIGWGASGRSGGQVIPGLKELPEAIGSYFGPHMGKKIMSLAGSAPDYVFSLINKYKINCAAAQTGWIQASVSRHGLDINKEMFRQWGAQNVPIEFLSASDVSSLIGSDNYSGGALDVRGGKLHPLNYVLGLAQVAQQKGATIYQDSPVLGIKKNGDSYAIECSGGQILASRVVLATNGYGDTLSGTKNRNVIPVQSVQVATRPLSDNVLKTILPRGQVVSDTRRLLKYFRIAENGRLLVGGRGGTSKRTTQKQIQELKLFATEMFPNIGGVEFDYVWGGNVALTLDHFPQICSFDNGIISLSGYNGRGVALTTTLGRVVGEFLNGKPALELDFPVKRLKTIPFQEFQKVIVPFAAWYKKLLDSIDR